MRTRHLLLALAGSMAMQMAQAQQQYWNSLPGGNLIGTTEYLGARMGSSVPLVLKTEPDLPIDFYTSNLFRARINPTTSYAIGTAPNAPRNGFMLLSGRPAFINNVRGPFSRLHLVDDVGTAQPIVYAQDIGYRQWMRNGITFTGNSDQAYLGQKYYGNDNTDFVIQWSDNPEPQPWGTDRMKFIFSSVFTGSHTGMGSEYGLEAMRFWPKNADEVNVGVGDFFAAGNTDPTERLHVRDGRVRIEQLPDDAEAPTLTKFLVVDDTPSPSGERGVVKWRNMPTGTGGGCEWTLLGLPGSNSDIATAYSNNPGCPQADRKVGIGTNAPQYKLDVRHNVADGQVSGGVNVSFTGPGSGWSFGTFSETLPQTGSSLQHSAGVLGQALGVDDRGYGLLGKAFAEALDGNATLIHGTSGQAWGPTNGSVLASSCGAYGESIGRAGGSITKSYGLFGKSSGSGITESYGVYGYGRDGTTNYGVYGEATNGANNWAGYFPGNTYTPGGLWTSSDVQLKQNIADLPIDTAISKLLQLAPKTYDFNQDQFGFMHLPTEHQYGLIAQDVEAVLPTLVTNIHQPAMLDTAGKITSPEVDFKAMNYQGFIPLLIAGFQAQQKQIAALQAKVAQCCASNPGLAPSGRGEQKDAPSTSALQEQRLQVIPNPVAELTTLAYYVPAAGKVSLQVSTIDGKPLATLREEMAEPGAYQYTWNTNKLVPGTYLCTYMLDGAVVVQKAVKVAR